MIFCWNPCACFFLIWTKTQGPLSSEGPSIYLIQVFIQLKSNNTAIMNQRKQGRVVKKFRFCFLFSFSFLFFSFLFLFLILFLFSFSFLFLFSFSFLLLFLFLFLFSFLFFFYFLVSNFKVCYGTSRPAYTTTCFI